MPSGHDPSHYVTRRLLAPAPDGTQVPVTVLYRRDTKLDGSAPVWLYGYGAYGDTEHPEFGIERLSLVDRGFIYAIAHVRGGGEKGDAWHDAGRLANKVNTFTDLSGRRRASGALADDLGPAASSPPAPPPAARWSAPPSTCGPTCSVPSTPRCRSSIASTRCSTARRRSRRPASPSSAIPIDSRADFLNIQSYSPYENVRAQAYPPMLIFQSLNDARVPYWEAAKWVAKLRHLKTDANAVVLYVKMRGGHSGGSGRFDSLEDYARAYAFALGDPGRGLIGPRSDATGVARSGYGCAATACQEAVRRERLLQEADRIGRGGLGPRRRVEVRRHEQGADGKALPDLGRRLDAVPVAQQAHIHEHQVGALALDDTHGLGRGVGRADDGMSGRPQMRRQVETNEDIILHDDDAMMAH